MKKKTFLISAFILGLVSALGQKNEDFFLVIEKQSRLSDSRAKEIFKVDGDEYLDYFNLLKDTIVDNQYLVIYEYYMDGPPESSIYLGLFDTNGFLINDTKLISCELDCPDGGYSIIIDHSVIEISAIYYKIPDEVYSKYYEKLSDAQKGMAYGQRSLIKTMVADSEKEINKVKYCFQIGEKGIEILN